MNKVETDDEIELTVRDIKEYDGGDDEPLGHGPRYSFTETPAELASMRRPPPHSAIQMMKKLPNHILGFSFTRNSFFARRLFVCGMILSILDGCALTSAYLSDELNFSLWKDKEDCNRWIEFAMQAYWSGPIIFLLTLPATGIRWFELFTRKKPTDLTDKKFKVKRTLYLQFCEVMAVLLVLYMAALFIFCLIEVIDTSFKCHHLPAISFSLVSILVFFSQVTFLGYFTRFREHIKMQLGAFRESNQTGNVRSHWGLRKSNEGRIRKQLYKAVEHGNNEEVEALLLEARQVLGESFASRVYPSASLIFGYFAISNKNPVHVAASMGNIPALKLLFAAGFNVNALDKVSRVRFSTSDLFWFFIRHIVDHPISSMDQDRHKRLTLLTPLHCAVATSQIDTVRYLVDEKQATVDILAVSPYSADRIPPLFHAEHPKIVEILLLAGANHLMVPEPGKVNCITALEVAYLRENYAVCAALEDWGGDVALTPLHRYAALGNDAKVEKYLKMKVDPNCLGEHGYIGINIRTPLHWAAINGQASTVLILLQGGADPNFQDARGRSPLHWAVRNNKVQVVKLLLENGADANLQDSKGMTPTICSAFAEHVNIDLLRSLVQYGANINFQMKSNGDTALHIAIKHEKQDTATALVGCGASIMAINHAGSRAIDIATSTALQFAIKSAAGHRDVMISYTHSHAEFALKLRRSLESVNITAWLDTMDPSGIGGGSIWREEIAKGISNATLLVAIISEDYTRSEWCLKELATAKQVGTPVLPISTEHVRLNEELQVYLYTRQIVPFEPAIIHIDNTNPRNILYQYNDEKYNVQFRLLLDGIRDEIEKRRKKTAILRSQPTMSPTSMNHNGLFISPRSSPANNILEKKFIFLAHGDCHRTFAKRLYSELTKKKQMECYLDLKTTKEMSLRVHAAKDAILRCSAVIVILSAKSVKSELLNDQLAFAEDKGKPIFPVIFHNDFILPPNQMYSLSRTPMFHFAMDIGFNSSLDHLMTSLKTQVGLNTIEELDEEINLNYTKCNIFAIRSALSKMPSRIRLATIFLSCVSALAGPGCAMTQDCLNPNNTLDFNDCIPKALKTVIQPLPMSGIGWANVTGGGKCQTDTECHKGKCTNGACICKIDGVTAGAHCEDIAIQCPEYKDSACCSWQQNRALAANFKLISSIFGSSGGGCDACAVNIMQLWCGLVCSPFQANFMSMHAEYPSITYREDPMTGATDVKVLEMNVSLSTPFTCGLFDSCKSTPLVSVTDALKSSVGFLNYQGQTGSIGHGQYIYLQFGRDESFFNHSNLPCDNYTVVNDPSVFKSLPLQAQFLQTIATPSGSRQCPCSTCRKSCNTPTNSSTHISLVENPISVWEGFDVTVVGVTYACIAVFSAIVYRLHRKK